MKKKILKLNKPCLEKWENMKPNENGNFCNLCSKTVIDFTKLNQYEIAEKIKKANGNICARLTQEQLNMPLLNLETQKQINLPYSNIATSLIVATALTTGQPLQAKNQGVKTEIVQTTNTVSKSQKNIFESKTDNPKTNKFTTLKGTVKSEKKGKPIENAKVIFVTVQKILTTYTKKDGTFSLKIPTNLIENDNVIRISYNEINNNKKNPLGYETTNLILTKADFKNFLRVKAKAKPKELTIVLGQVSYETENTKKPIVIYNGNEIKFKNLIKNCNIENKDFYYFDSKFAVAIYGKEAKSGLFILTDKPKE